MTTSDLRERLRVDAQRLTGWCDPATLPFESTDEIHPLEAVFGQERAVRAIEFALGMPGRGYNLYASGPDGLGKTTVVESFLRRRAAQLPAPPDWVYVHNFEDPDRPVGIALPAGQGRAFAAQVAQAVESALQELRRAFESDSYARQRAQLGQQIEQQRAQLLETLRTHAQSVGFLLQMSPSGIVSTPLINGQPATEETFNGLNAADRTRIEEQAKELERQVQETMLQMRALDRQGQEQLRALDEQTAAFAIEHLFTALTSQWGADGEIAEFLRTVQSDIQSQRAELLGQGQQPLLPGLGMPRPAPSLNRYEVNALVVNDPNAGAPVVIERNPTYYNLVGRIEYVGQFGTMATDHTLIKPGALARANGGFLVLRLRDLVTNALSYDALKRALLSGAVQVENISESMGLVPTTGLRPEPIPLQTKVVIVGDAGLYSYLFRADPDFRELFRVKADFEVDVPRTRENILGIAAVVRQQCERQQLLCFSREAIARLVQHSSRLVEDQRRLSGNMGVFTDLLRQADYWARQSGAGVVGAEHIERALEESLYRSALVRDRLQQMIDDGSIFIDTSGEAIGQINALSVYDLGDMMFGRPSRITCVTSPGRGTITNVEREADMAGRIHNKGFMILRGFLADRFGQQSAMALNAQLTFEQLYSDIDGDSASSTEIYALLSSLAQVPIRQTIAVTGSVNQRGEIQPIGGGTYKIEGFYEVCLARGLDGTQGVIVPRTNVENISLRPDVAEAIAAGRFHVWGVTTIEEGIELLTGMPAGQRGADGTYPEGTLFRRVEERLRTFAHALEGQPNGATATFHMPVAPPTPSGPPGIPPGPPPAPPVIV